MQYTVKSGDTLSSIAQKFYGSANRYPEIVAANPIVEDADRIEIGWILEIPNVNSQLPERPPAIPPQIMPVPPAPTPASGSNKTMLIVLVLGAAVLGYMLIKHFASKGESAQPAKKEEPETVEAV